jgi:hypothetical protein
MQSPAKSAEASMNPTHADDGSISRRSVLTVSAAVLAGACASVIINMVT